MYTTSRGYSRRRLGPSGLGWTPSNSLHCAKYSANNRHGVCSPFHLQVPDDEQERRTSRPGHASLLLTSSFPSLVSAQPPDPLGYRVRRVFLWSRDVLHDHLLRRIHQLPGILSRSFPLQSPYNIPDVKVWFASNPQLLRSPARDEVVHCRRCASRSPMGTGPVRAVQHYRLLRHVLR